MKIFVITDTHFNHKQLIEYGRPKDFEEKIKENLKKVISEKDLLIHLGDICIGKDKENSNWFKENLGCKTFLVKGNHDGKSFSWYLENGWDSVSERMDIKRYNKRIALTHAPIAWDGYFDVNLHGHFHDTDGRRQTDFDEKIMSGYNKLLAMEYTDYKPLLLKSLFE